MIKVIAIGNVTKDIELRKTNSGKSVVQFTLACKEGKATEFVDCTIWEKGAELVNQFVSKGQKLCVEGTLKTDTYEGQTGKVRKTYVLVNNFEFCGSKADTNATPTEPKHNEYIDVKTDDLPFF